MLAEQRVSCGQVAALVHQYDRVEHLVRLVQGVSVLSNGLAA